jgi:cell division protein FtsB
MLARLRSYIPTAILAFLIFYFGFQALTGDRGLLSRGERLRLFSQGRIALAELVDQRQDLERRAQLLRDQGLSIELLDERARSTLGLADPRDYVIRTGR